MSAEGSTLGGRITSSTPRTAQASPRPGGTRLVPRRLTPLGRLLGPLVLLALWELAARTGLLSPKLLAAPSTAVITGYDMLANGTLLPHWLASAWRAWWGLGIGVAAAVLLALVSGLTRIGEASIDSLVQIKRAIPTLALIPLAILWLGIGETMKIALIAGSVFVPVYINTHAAIKGIDIRHVELARTLGLGKAVFIRRIVLPGALPGFFTGLRLSVTSCWASLVVLEQINTTQGIGYLMNRARDYGQTEIIVVGLVIYMVLGLASDAAVRAIERSTLRYRKVIGS
ncbi:ABC transporter permease [Azotobacter vinelandii]|uniref:ABC transporter permease n=1 Tax=Azotobacter vinelandii TaxID=354 RepID=UPI000772FF5E|nr:ABC transporter permease [Azotobacter vinelandii]